MITAFGMRNARKRYARPYSHGEKTVFEVTSSTLIP